MATLVDSLIISLDLDPKNFNKGQKEAAQAFLKTKEQAVASGKTIEDASKKAADSISRIAKEALSLYAVFLGARGIKEFTSDLLSADAALGRFSRNLNQAPQTVQAWGMAAERMGGSNEATAASFERIGKSLYELQRNGAMLPKEYSQLEALTNVKIDRNHGIDKFLNDTAAALKAMNAIDPMQAHFLAQGIGIDDATANVMIKYGSATGDYINQIKKLSASDGAIKAAQDLQDKWVTLQQTAVSLANTVVERLAPTLGQLLTQMTNWVTKNQDWIRSGIVEHVGEFANFIKSIDWNAVGQGLKDFGNDAKAVVEAIGGITTATEILFGLWAGSKAIAFASGMRTLLGGGGSAAASVAGAAGAGSGMLGMLGRIFGVGAAAYMLTDASPAPDMKTMKYAPSGWNSSKNAQPDYNSLTRDPGAHGELLNEGSPVSKGNPLPVTMTGTPTQSGGFWSSVGSAITTMFGGGTSSAGNTARSGLSGIAGTVAAGTRSLTGSNAEVVAFIRQKAIEMGIDPNIALRVAGHEGLPGFDPTKNNGAGDGNSSFGPYQLHYGGMNPAMPHAGLGDEFTKATGLDARNGSTWKDQVIFALGKVRQGGWGPWMGAKAEGITGKMGVGPMPMNAPIPSGARMSATMGNLGSTSTSTSSNEVNVNGPINIHTAATDANGIAQGISGALQRSTAATIANHGPH